MYPVGLEPMGLDTIWENLWTILCQSPLNSPAHFASITQATWLFFTILIKKCKQDDNQAPAWLRWRRLKGKEILVQGREKNPGL